MFINFSGPKGSILTYSYVDVLNNRIDLSIFKNKIVLIGATASDLHDEQMTPISMGQPLPGVEIHANAISTILNNKFLVAENKTTAILIILLIGILTGLLFPWLKGWKSLILTIISIVGYYFMVAFYFEKGLILDAVFPPFTLILSYTAISLYQYMSVEKEKRQIKTAFSQYVEPTIINEILKDPSKLKLGGEKKELTIFFSDIKNFTTISEVLKPEILVTLLNEYFTEMANIILKNKGVVDKYIGDSIMVIWGAPLELENHAFFACKTALEMKNRLTELRKQWKTKNLPELEMRIGINTGKVVVGNMGSDKRFDYTVMGDPVNLASRLEGLNKEYGTEIIISRFTYEKVKNDFLCRPLGTVQVKGKKEPVEIYELVDFKPSTSSEYK
jgi:adenylate cyclase